MQKHLEETRKLIDRVKENIKNKQTRDLILKYISKVIDNSKAKLDVSDNWFIGTIKKNKECFTVTFFPSLEELKDIYIEGAENNGYHKFNRVIRFDADMIKVTDINQYMYGIKESNTITTIQDSIVEEIYIENILVYSNDNFIETSNKDTYKRQKEKYYSSSGVCVENQNKIVNDVVISDRYFECNNCLSTKFDDNEDKHNKCLLQSNEEKFNTIKNEVEFLLNKREFISMKF